MARSGSGRSSARRSAVSPANAAVPWRERLRWFQAFFEAVSTKGASTASQPPA